MTWSILEDFAALKAMLLEDELSYDPTTPDDIKTFWDNADLTTSEPQEALFPLMFSASLPNHAKLRVVIENAEASPIFSAVSDNRSVQTTLTENIKNLSGLARHEDMPMVYMYTGLQEAIDSSPVLREAEDDEAVNTMTAPDHPAPAPRRLRSKSALLWAHHLLANSKRKDIQHWSTELKVWAIAKIGYPGVMVFEGLEEDVDEFIKRIKALQWYALQVRYEETFEAQEDASETDVLASCGLAKACQPSEKMRHRPFAHEVESMSDLSSLMTLSNMREAFAASMKLPA
ncbi:hypothetical protein P389DRAFT_10611 [Cystobasidium minutum MCA 4210]|uniref:uncharacterized protein n=1 Tax=Cystobasidium minutum MCA 4210 TaxID=1397322 RepID=UPI0034CE1756|eukprot:jgi/Rhomi1/10611/CE10610_542